MLLAGLDGRKYISTYFIIFLMRKFEVINSVIVVNLDEDEKIERLVDQWNGAELPTRFGAQYLRIVIAKVLPWLISFPKTAT